MMYYYSYHAANPKEWTLTKSLWFLLATFEVLVIVILLVNNYHLYDRYAQVWSWVWGVATAVLGAMGLGKGKDKSLSELLDAIVSKLIIGVYAAIGVIFLLLAECPRHTVIISTMVESDTVDNVRITWNGKYVGKSDSGKVIIEGVRRGNHRYSAYLRPYTTKPGTVDIVLGDLFRSEILEEVRWSAEELCKGWLNIGAEGDTAEIWIDTSWYSGKMVPRTVWYSELRTPSLLALPVGEYLIELKRVHKKGMYYKKAIVAITEDDTCTQVLKLDYIPPPKGEVTIVSQPAGADIYMSGRYTGKKTPATVRLDSGKYRLELRKKEGVSFGYYFRKENLHIEGYSKSLFDTAFKERDMRRLKELYIYSDPQAQIFVDGKYEGQTNANEPIYLFVSDVPSEVILKAYGYHDWIVDLPELLPFTDTIRLIKID